jgi:hypothetical protein
MRLPVIYLALGAALTAGTAQAAPPSIEIKDAVARVTVIPEARSDIKVEYLSTNPQLPLQIRNERGRVVIDGKLEHKIRNCTGEGARTSVDVTGVGAVAYANMPQVVIRAPRDVSLDAGGAVFGVIGKSDSLKLSNAGCGDWTVANVEGELKLNQAGSGDTHVGAVGRASVRVAGSGDIKTQAVRGPLDVNIAGSGDLWSASVGGALDVKIAGSGDVRVAGGPVGPMTVSVAGSGGVDVGAAAESLKARIAGSGDVRVKSVKGAVSKAIVGSGDVIIG